MVMFHLSVYEPLESGQRKRAASMDLDANATDLRFTTDIRFGFGRLEAGINGWIGEPVVGYLPRPIDLSSSPAGAHVELSVGSALVFEGFIVSARRGAGGGYIAFTAEGYMGAMKRNWSRSVSGTSITSGEALRTAIQNDLSMLTVGNDEEFIDPGVLLSSGMAEVHKMTVAELADQVMNMGNLSGDQVDVSVWENRIVHCLPRVAPDTPHYRIGFDPARVSWDEDYTEMASEVTVEYGSASSGTLTSAAQATGTAAALMRQILLTVGSTSSTAAQAIRDKELARRATPTVQATINVTADEASWLPRRDGMPEPFYLVRAGRWVQVADAAPLAIVSTSCDLTGGSATYELGAPDPSLPKNQGRVIRETVAKQRRFLLPLAGRMRA